MERSPHLQGVGEREHMYEVLPGNEGGYLISREDIKLYSCLLFCPSTRDILFFSFCDDLGQIGDVKDLHKSPTSII